MERTVSPSAWQIIHPLDHEDSTRRAATRMRPTLLLLTMLVLLVVGVASAQAAEWEYMVPQPPSPKESHELRLPSISCTVITGCMAVGFFRNSSSKNMPLAERYPGSIWKLEEPPIPTSALEGQLAGVSCIKTTACTAAGQFKSSAKKITPLTDTWNGTSWTAHELSSPSGAKASSLAAVSCTSATSCTAVGNFENSASKTVPLSEIWNGTSWSIQEPPIVAGSQLTELVTVSCTSSEACMAAGNSINSAGKPRAVTEQWNGTSWTVTEGTEDTVKSIACHSATACAVVGETTSGEEVYAENWNGTKWAKQKLAPPSVPQDSLLGVSCPEWCMAVGYGGSEPLMEDFTPISWILYEPPGAPSAERNVLEDVWCSRSEGCTAIGYDRKSSEDVPYAEHMS